MKTFLGLLLALLAAGCASDGRNLEPGKARLADVEATMGAPTERIASPDGDSHLYYVRGRKTFVAVVGPDRMLKRIEQRLGYDTFKKLVPNTTQAKDVRELLGPPLQVARMPRQARDVWEYPWQNYEELRILWLQFSYDGTLREVIELRDEAAYPQTGPSKD